MFLFFHRFGEVETSLIVTDSIIDGHLPIPLMQLMHGIFKYLPTFTIKINQPNLGKYTMHGNKFPASDWLEGM